MKRTVANRFVNDDVPIANFDIVQARGIGANPRFVLDRSSLATKIRKRDQITFIAFATPGKSVFHETASFLSHRGLNSSAGGEPPPLHPRPHSKPLSMPCYHSIFCCPCQQFSEYFFILSYQKALQGVLYQEAALSRHISAFMCQQFLVSSITGDTKYVKVLCPHSDRIVSIHIWWGIFRTYGKLFMFLLFRTGECCR